MLPTVNPTGTTAWKRLTTIQQTLKDVSLADLFEEGNRFDKWQKSAGNIHIDFSKNHLTDEVLDAFLALAGEVKLSESIQMMHSGQRINEREDRAVMHYALRSSKKDIKIDGSNVIPDVNGELDKIRTFTSQVHNGIWLGYTGKPIRNIVNIGIGGSDLGPKMVCQALLPYRKEGMRAFFLSNVDANNWIEIRDQISPEETLFIIASKTFTTDETMTNAQTVRKWFLEHAGDEKAIGQHFAAVSTNMEEVGKFGIPDTNVFGFWNWVGGRFSLWSSIGLSIALTVGYEHFEGLLRGAEEMDQHFFETPLEDNLPFLMGAVSIWYNNFWNQSSRAVLPYNHLLIDFTRFLQQMIMESNGKQVDRSGKRLDYAASPIYWGEPGTNGQHAFHQLLHQGTDIVPCDFIAVLTSTHGETTHDRKLLANCFAQSEALMMGRKHEDPFRTFEGNRPSTTLLLKDLSPQSLGALIALYEHMVFVQGIIWNIYSFDQWGVELGKELAKKIQASNAHSHPSTEKLVALSGQLQK